MIHVKSFYLFESHHRDTKLFERIVITGAPGTGKSSVTDELLKIGYDVIEEPARVLIKDYQKNAPQNLPWNNRDFFQKAVEDLCIENYNNNRVGFFDRSLVDEIGFRLHYKMDIPEDLLNKCKKYRYDKVFIFPPWKEIFKNDEVRKETFEQSVQINDSLIEGYEMVGYHPIEVPKLPIEKRISFILDNI